MIYGKQEIYNLLKTKGIAFEKLEHEAVYTMEDMNKAGITATVWLDFESSRQVIGEHGNLDRADKI